MKNDNLTSITNKLDLLIGPAIGEFENENLKNAIEGYSVVELQLTNFQWTVDDALADLAKKDYISVHNASRDIDLSSANEQFRQQSIVVTKQGMDFAYKVNSNTLVLHPVNNMHLNPTQRLESVVRFMKSFEELKSYYEKENHQYTMCVENLEYPKYPATLEETLDLQKRTSTGIVIDVPHIWHSRDILLENPDYYRNLTLGFPFAESLNEDLTTFLESNSELVTLFHVAGFGHKPLRTHAPIYKELNSIYVDLRSELIKKPIIMEIYNQSKEEIEMNKKVFRGR